MFVPQVFGFCSVRKSSAQVAGEGAIERKRCTNRFKGVGEAARK